MNQPTRHAVDPGFADALASHTSDTTATAEPRASSPVLPGAVLLDRFEVRSRLGAGGMGVVYEAFDRQLGVKVALKFLHGFGARALYRLKQEFKAMNALGPHPNLIAPSGLFCENGLWFVSMELVHGQHLVEHMRPAGKLDSHRVRAALVQLGQGLHAMHRQGKVHRDLKPSNVLVTAQGRVVILDFGLVSDRDGPARWAGRSGTPRYMAPEQARGEPAAEASDCYAVGVMLYEALTGLSPFECDSVETLVGKQEREPLSPALLVPDLPPELVALCTKLLARDPSDRPSAAALLAALDRPPAPEIERIPAAAHTELVGRVEELGALRAALRRTDDGRPQIVLIEGPSAVGKSALADAFLSTMPEGTVALRSRCHVRADVPFKALDALIDELSGFLGGASAEDAQRWAPQDLDALLQMFPVLARVDALRALTRRAPQPAGEHELRRRAAAALRELLGRIAAEQPLVLFIDDLQWGDADSATLLRELLRMPGAPPLLLLGAHRADERENSQFISALRALAAEAGFELQTLTVLPLAEPDAELLARRLLGSQQEPALAATIAREACGMPLFVRELAAQVRKGLLGAQPAGAALGSAIVRRAQTLPESVQLVLELVSIAHAPLPESVILDAANLSEVGPTSVRRLCLESLLRVVGDGRLDAYHDRVRESVAEHIAPERRSALHVRLVEALQRSGRAQPDWLAAHALSAGRHDLAVRASLEAAEGALRKLAFEHAAAHYRTALGVLAPDDPRRGELLVRLGDACRLDGRGREAGDAFAQAAEHVGAGRRRDLLRRAAETYLSCGYIDRGIDTMLPVLASLGLAFPKKRWQVRLSLVWELVRVKLARLRYRERDESAIDSTVLARIDACSSLGMGMLSTDEATGLSPLFLLRALRLALRAGTAHRAAYVECVVAGMPKGNDDYDHNSQPLIERVLELARRFGDRHLEAWAYTNAGIGHVFATRGAQAIAYATRCRQVCEECGIFAGLTVVGAERAHQLGCMLAGRIGELAEVGPEYARRAQARADLFASSLTNIYAALPMLAADDPEGAFARVEGLMSSGSVNEHWQRWRQDSGSWPNLAHALLLGTWALLYSGRGGDAFEHLLARWPVLKRRGYLKTPVWRAFYYHCRGMAALAAAADAAEGYARRRAWRDARRAVRALRRIRSVNAAAAFADVLQVGICATEGDRGAAMMRLQAAVAVFEALEMQLFAASARRRIGELEGGPTGAQQVLAADARMRELGVSAPERWARMYVPDISRA